MNSASSTTRRGRWLPWVGLVAGLGWALAEIALPAERATDPAVAARVNGVAITRDRFLTALASLATERNGRPITNEERRRILDEMIDEELLVSRAIELDYARRVPTHRKQLVESMREHVTSAIDGEATIDDSTLRAYYTEHAADFSGAPRYQVDWVFVRGADHAADDRAVAAQTRLSSGESLEAVRAAVGDAPLVDLPDGPLTESAIRQYLGPTVARTVGELEVGTVCAPVRVAGGLSVVRVREKTPGAPPPFEEVQETVRDLLRRKAEGEALRSYVRDLRRTAIVERDDALLEDAPIPEPYLARARVTPREQVAP